MSEEKRNAILVELAKHTGKRVSPQFIRQTASYVPNIERFHNLIAGIYKPAWSNYALSIVVSISSPYEKKDEVIFLEDGRWLMTYSPRTGGLQHAENRALVKCMDERVPIGVFRQLTKKTNRHYGSTYRILGLGLVTSYDASADVFIVESVDSETLERITNFIANETVRYEVLLYSQMMNSFQPFVHEERASYSSNTLRRDRAFREIVVREYDYTCAVCEMKFRLNSLVEATAAHIIPKHKHGTDDPRNGLSLCRTHHWAFDNGVFTLTDDYEVMLSPLAEQADSHNFALMDMQQKSILLPANEIFQPHPDVIRWHRANIWRS